MRVHMLSLTPKKMAMLEIFFLDMAVSSAAGASCERRATPQHTPHQSPPPNSLLTPHPSSLTSPTCTVSPMKREYVCPAVSSADGLLSPANPMLTLNTIPLLAGIWDLGLRRREPSRNSIPVTNLGEGGREGGRGRGRGRGREGEREGMSE